MSIENKVRMSDFTEVTDIADTARIIGLQDNENVKIPLQSLISKTLSRVDEDILTIQDINVDGGVTGFNPIGEVENNNLQAVNGSLVYKDVILNSVINVDNLPGKPLGSEFHTKNTARNAVPLKYRKKGIGIQYMSNAGLYTEYFISGNYSSNNDSWISFTNNKFVGKLGRVLNDLGSELVQDNDSIITSYIRLTNNIIAKNTFNLTGTKSICFTYDDQFNFLGVYNSENTFSGIVEEKKIIVSDLKSIYPKAEYIRFNSKINKGFSCVYDAVSYYPNIVNNPIININDLFINNGYINKSNGKLVTDDGYVSTGYLKINKNTGCLVTGYSGVSNNVALAYFYDKNFKPLGYVNSASNGNVYNFSIAFDKYPDKSYYVIITKAPNQLARVDGLIINFNASENQKVSNQLIKESKPALKYYINKQYVSKVTGILNPSDGYMSSIFLEIDFSKDKLLINGFSGTNNNAALLVFYDEKLNYISAVNGPTQGNVLNYEVLKSTYPIGAKYVRTTASNNSSIAKIEGVIFYDNMLDIQSLIDSYSNKSADGISRGVKANVFPNGNLKFKNYLGNDQNIHPKVIYFKDSWNGFKYWMAYTPYPAGETTAENPCIAVSNDGITWTVPNGLVNPLAFAPVTTENPQGYNSDTHLVYREDLNQLECWWREYNPTTSKDSVVRKISTNGIDWGQIEVVLGYEDLATLSPAVIYEDGKYKMWYCLGGTVRYTESTDASLGSWSAYTTLPINLNGVSAWHLDVELINGEYYFLIQGYTAGNNNNTSDLYLTKTADFTTFTDLEVVVYRGDLVTDIDYKGIYRSCIIYVDGVFKVYYTGISNNFNSRTINLTSGRSVNTLRGVNMP